MAQTTPTPEPTEAALTIAMAAGMRMAAELVYRVGPAAALGSIGDTLQSTLTEQERGVLAAAAALVMDMRNTPDDLSTLGHVDLSPCADSSCPICRRSDTA